MSQEDIDSELFEAFDDLDIALNKRKSSMVETKVEFKDGDTNTVNNLQVNNSNTHNINKQQQKMQQYHQQQQQQEIKQKEKFNPLGKKARRPSKQTQELQTIPLQKNQLEIQNQNNHTQKQQQLQLDGQDQNLIEEELNMLLEHLSPEDEKGLQQLFQQMTQGQGFQDFPNNGYNDLALNPDPKAQSSKKLSMRDEGGIQDVLKTLAKSRGENIETQEPGVGSEKQQINDGEDKLVGDIMQFLVSKEVLYQPMKDIGSKYPNWLQENKGKIDDTEYMQYHRQYELLQEVLQVYDKNPEDYSLILDKIQEMKESGQPPKEILSTLAPGQESDLSFISGQSQNGQNMAQQCPMQ